MILVDFHLVVPGEMSVSEAHGPLMLLAAASIYYGKLHHQ
jgi:hypothetical protein